MLSNKKNLPHGRFSRLNFLIKKFKHFHEQLRGNQYPYGIEHRQTLLFGKTLKLLLVLHQRIVIQSTLLPAAAILPFTSALICVEDFCISKRCDVRNHHDAFHTVHDAAKDAQLEQGDDRTLSLYPCQFFASHVQTVYSGKL